MSNYEYLLSDINSINGVGSKTSKLLKKKNINTIFDLIWCLPQSFIDRTNTIDVKDLQIGKVQTVRVYVKKYSFPRVRNLPKKVLCEDSTGKLECVFFNSYDGYIKKILPMNSQITISGKINYYKNRYQITNPTNLSSDENSVKKISSVYSLTEGLTAKSYDNIINKALQNIPDLDEWLSQRILKKFNFITWKKAILNLHNPKNVNKKGDFLKRLIFDEIFSNFLINSNIRQKIKKY